MKKSSTIEIRPRSVKCVKTVSEMSEDVQPLSAQQQDVKGEQVAVAGSAQLPPHLRLFGYGYLKYRFSRHSKFTSAA